MAGNSTPGYGEKITVFEEDKKGKGLKAKYSLDIGDILVNEKPIAFVVSNKQRANRCANCLESSPNLGHLRKCSKCKFVFYCGTSCQKKDWSNHKQECRNILNVQPKRPPDLCLLASRFLSIMAKKLSNNTGDEIDERGPLFNQRLLEFRETFSKKNAHISGKRKEMLFTFSVVLKMFLDSKILQLLGILQNDLICVLCWLTCNCFNIFDDDMNSVGVGIYETTCLLNHNCLPNCVAVFEGPKISVRAIRPVKQDEELTISYIESLESKESRNQELQERYFFQCECEQCLEENKSSVIVGKCPNKDCCGSVLIKDKDIVCESCWFSYFADDFVSNVQKYHAMLNASLENYRSSNSEHDFAALCKATNGVLSSISSESIVMVKCQEALIDRFIELQHWEQAIDSGMVLLDGYLRFYPEFHPITGIHLFRLGKMEILIDRLRSGLEHLERAKHILLITHGKEHRLFVNLLDTVAKLKEEIIHIENMGAGKGQAIKS